MGTESLLAQNTRVNRVIHDRGGFLLPDSMTCDLSCSVSQSSSHELKRFVGLAFTIGAEVAKESARNEEITKKSLEAKFRGLCVRTKADVHTHCHDLGCTSRLEPDPMHLSLWSGPFTVTNVSPYGHIEIMTKMAQSSLSIDKDSSIT
ncbi:hypothetical protein PIB30_059111 [Stylosanthes scabra]|uniref:Uncharacterized protein n=1 Tax=Stylosanthes scabra TaxID=79078 RepID=A0ABU6ZIV4_9FABA|nr:hypothetical protein [Stylosanthes scabra]